MKQCRKKLEKEVEIVHILSKIKKIEACTKELLKTSKIGENSLLPAKSRYLHNKMIFSSDESGKDDVIFTK